MINASELRVGNYLTFGKMKTPERVYQIAFDRTKRHLINGDVPESHCFGIPLTEEWLMKFSLSEKDSSYWCVDGVFYLERQENGEFWFEVYAHYRHIEFVHQLQNLYFALTGKELEIK